MTYVLLAVLVLIALRLPGLIQVIRNSRTANVQALVTRPAPNASRQDPMTFACINPVTRKPFQSQGEYCDVLWHDPPYGGVPCLRCGVIYPAFKVVPDVIPTKQVPK